MSGEPVIPPGSRAVLIGVPHYQDTGYSSYPAVGTSVDGMYELLAESGLCGWRREQVSKIVDPANAGQLLSRLRRLAQETTGVLLLYFVGHGALSEQCELCLAVSDTDHANPDATGLEYPKIQTMLRTGTPAATRIVILDCCYSGRAIGLSSSEQFADLSQVAGAYTLTAADELAHVSPGTGDTPPRTAFTGELLDLLTRDGIPGGPAGLTLGAIYPHLRGRLVSKGLPRPNQRADDQAADFVFARNAAAPPPRQPTGQRRPEGQANTADSTRTPGAHDSEHYRATDYLGDYVGRELTLYGIAENAKAGAIILCGPDSPVYIDGLSEWDGSDLNSAFEVTGTLVVNKGDPVLGLGKYYVMKNAARERIP